MITNKDLEIQNISYTNKDFGQIYPELLAAVKNITNKWDPETTNESDPGIVLLKALALVADKLNYNIDKNTLEQFITSASQETSVRRLTEMLGYNMGYYKSATVKISFRYLGELNKEQTDDSSVLDITNLSSFCIKAFDTKLETDDGVIYTLLQDINIDVNNKVQTDKLAIQGELKTLSMLGDNSANMDLIQLYNLDDQNRIYFPDPDVAENGVFINREVPSLNSSDETTWHRVDNLNDQDLGSKVFKFGYDSAVGYPYIEFPKDIADLIGDGLQISYIISTGVDGKISNGKLTKLSSVKITSGSDSTEALSINISDDVYALANSASTEGKNPESIDEAYNNFKKTVGTFNTLVSCKDYSNYLNTYEDDLGNRIVSQIQATDLRTDLEYSKKIFTRDSSGASYYKNTIIKDNGFYDLILHGTPAVNSAINNATAYNRSYSNLSNSDISIVNETLDQVKNIVHNIITPAVGKLNFIEADYGLKVNISTKYKVNSTEQKDIIANVKSALYDTFNASKLDFGEEIPYDAIVNCIQNADTRIKNVNLADPDITYYLRNQGVNSKVLFEPIKDNKFSYIIADNILAGALPLYGDLDKFNFDYLQKDYSEINNIVGIYCNFSIPANTDTTLKENESIQLLKDSFKTSVIYPTGINYAFSNGTTAQSIVIKKNQIYRLKTNDILYLEYTDSDGNNQFVTCREGSIIKPTFDIVNTNGSSRIKDKIDDATPDVSSKTASKFVDWTQRKIINDSDLTANSYEQNTEKYKNITPLFGIGASEEIDIVEKNEVTIKRNNNIFWYIKPKLVKNNDSSFTVTNEEGSLILTENPYNTNECYYILEEGEYFIYPNDDATSLNILQSGTKITINKLDSEKLAKTIKFEKLNNTSITLESLLETSIADDDVGTFTKAFKWETINRSITIRESIISNFVESTINTETAIDSAWNIINSLKIDGVEYLDNEIENIEEPLTRAVLSLNSDKDTPQKRLRGQEIVIMYSDKTQETEESKSTTKTKVLAEDEIIQVYPMVDTYNNLGVLQTVRYDIDDSEMQILIDTDGNYLHEYLYSANCYTEIIDAPEKNTLDLLIYNLTNSNKVTINSRDEYVIRSADLQEFTALQINPPAAGLYYSVFDSLRETTKLYKSESNTDGSIKPIIIDNFDSLKTAGNVVYISKPKQLALYKYLTDLNIENIEDIIKDTIADDSFDWLGERNNSKLISAYDALYSFFDPNNRYNNLTLAKIDFTENVSEFNIVGSSKL